MSLHHIRVTGFVLSVVGVAASVGLLAGGLWLHHGTGIAVGAMSLVSNSLAAYTFWSTP